MIHKTGFAPSGMCYDPVTATVIAIGVAGTAAAGATAYSAQKESTASKKAAEAQERVGMAQIEASLKAPQLAKDAAAMKLKAKQASNTPTILTAPGGLQTTDEYVNKTILGV